MQATPGEPAQLTEHEIGLVARSNEFVVPVLTDGKSHRLLVERPRWLERFDSCAN
ncbi:hypothetical protein [Natrinema salaciae]|uniref:hypothetical protein n=1 Tax=Natrinema salaciae TaxID=1186196 RepID=UPI001587C1C7|nr:hypothetical protein [Natrinema salaciae]